MTQAKAQKQQANQSKSWISSGDTDLEEQDMDVDEDGAATTKRSPLSKREIKRRQTVRAERVEKRRKPRNRITFSAHPKKKGKGGKR